MPLSPTDQTSISSASDTAIEVGGNRVRTHFQAGRWLDPTNPYALDPGRATRAYIRQQPTGADEPLREYIAASAPLHCLDGWTFLSGAIESHVRGDAFTSVHLAYYAELRAAVSLLATQGVGTFNDLHLAIDSNGIASLVPSQGNPRRRRANSMGTHAFVWEALELWSQMTQTAAVLGEVISDGRNSLSDWLGEFSSGYINRSIGSDWLRLWGLDLKLLVEDRQRRNLASYRPTALMQSATSSALDASRRLVEIWKVFDPGVGSGFASLDRYLIRSALSDSYNFATGKRPDDDPSDFRQRIIKTISNLSIDARRASEWESFLTRTTGFDDDDPLIMLEAMKQDQLSALEQHLQVICRAALLLRVATGVTARLLSRSGITSTDMEFWWRPLLENRGLLDPGVELTSLSDLWADIDSAISGLGQWESDKGATTCSRKEWHRLKAEDLSTLVGCERAGLWGLLP